MRVLFAGGGTGGHIMPIVSVKKELDQLSEERRIPMEYLFIGHLDDLGKKILDDAGIPYKSVYAGKVRRYASIDNVTDIFKAIKGFVECLWFVWQYMPDVTFGKGGYASVPATLVSSLYQVSTLIHESDAQAGWANKFLSRFVSVIAVGYERAKGEFPAKKTTLVGNMTQPGIDTGTRDLAAQNLKIVFEKPVILIIGGSQGAQAINQLVWKMLPDLLDRAEIIHIVGKQNYQDALSIKRGLDTSSERIYHPFDFITDDLKHAYAAADLVISRAGASSLLDIALNRKPSILAPLPGHQTVNAYEFAKVGAAVVIEAPNFTHHLVLSKIDELLSNPALLQDMSGHTARFATPDAARRIAEELLTISA